MKRRQSGFTLLEMVAATALLAAGLGIVLSSMGQSMQSFARGEVKTRMGLLALSLIEERSVGPLPVGISHGRQDGIDWRLECTEQGAASMMRLLHLRLTLSHAGREETFTTLQLRSLDRGAQP